MKKYALIDMVKGGDSFTETFDTEVAATKNADYEWDMLGKSNSRDSREVFAVMYGFIDEDGCFDMNTADVIKDYKNPSENAIPDSERDFEIVCRADRRERRDSYTPGYIVKYDEEYYFVYDGDKEFENIRAIEFWSTVERHWCVDDLDLEERTYFDAKTSKIIRSLDTEEAI